MVITRSNCQVQPRENITNSLDLLSDNHACSGIYKSPYIDMHVLFILMVVYDDNSLKLQVQDTEI